jgi:hypothetical protein
MLFLSGRSDGGARVSPLPAFVHKPSVLLVTTRDLAAVLTSLLSLLNIVPKDRPEAPGIRRTPSRSCAGDAEGSRIILAQIREGRPMWDLRGNRRYYYRQHKVRAG